MALPKISEISLLNYGNVTFLNKESNEELFTRPKVKTRWPGQDASFDQKKTLSPPWMLRLLTLHPATDLNHLLVKPLRRRMIPQLGVPTLHPTTNLNHLLVKPIPHLGVALKSHHALTCKMMQYPSSLSTPLLSQTLNLLPTHLKRGRFHQRKIVPAQQRRVHLMVLSISFTIGHRKMPTGRNFTAMTV